MTYRCLEKECGKVFSISSQYFNPYVICPHCSSKLVIIIAHDTLVSRQWWEKKNESANR